MANAKNRHAGPHWAFEPEPWAIDNQIINSLIAWLIKWFIIQQHDQWTIH